MIQHGRDDPRTPVSQGRLWFRRLKMSGVETEMYVFEDTPHMLSRPKERWSAQWQNWRWFSKHVWGENVTLRWE